jgi:hypothetical protein
MARRETIRATKSTLIEGEVSQTTRLLRTREFAQETGEIRHQFLDIACIAPSNRADPGVWVR